MKSQNKDIENLLRQKRMKILKEIDLIRKRKGLSETALASKMDMNKSYLSRILHGSSSNITLETIAKAEHALGGPVLVTPNEYEEGLMDNIDRFVFLLDAVLKYNPSAKDRLLSFFSNQAAMSNYTEGLALINAIDETEVPTDIRGPAGRWPKQQAENLLLPHFQPQREPEPEVCYA